MTALDNALACRLIENNMIREAESEVRGQVLQSPLEHLQGIWKQLVIPVQSNNVRGVDMLHRFLQRRAGTTVRLAKKPQSRVVEERLGNFVGAVLRSIINDQNTKCGLGLTKHTFYGVRDELVYVESRDEHGCSCTSRQVLKILHDK